MRVQDADAALLGLAGRIAGAPAPAGDATLVVRRHAFGAGSPPFAAHALFTDG